MLDVRGLVVTYPGPPSFTAVDGVDLRVEASATTGLVGESGSGKSSIVRCIIGLSRASAGRITLGDQDVTNARGRTLASLRRQVQLVFQDPYASLNPRMEIGQAVQEAASVAEGCRMSSPRCRAAARELLDLVGVPEALAQRYPHQLSGGQLQRVAIARALATKPRLLLLDEVTASLDVSVQAVILNLLRRLQRELDLSMLYISHDLSVVRYLSDHLYVMRKGRIVEQAPAQAVFDAPRHAYTQELLGAVPTLGGNRWRGRRATVAVPPPGG